MRANPLNLWQVWWRVKPPKFSVGSGRGRKSHKIKPQVKHWSTRRNVFSRVVAMLPHFGQIVLANFQKIQVRLVFMENTKMAPPHVLVWAPKRHKVLKCASKRGGNIRVVNAHLAETLLVGVRSADNQLYFSLGRASSPRLKTSGTNTLIFSIRETENINFFNFEQFWPKMCFWVFLLPNLSKFPLPADRVLSLRYSTITP